MDMGEIFRIQLEFAEPITEEQLNKCEYKHYFNGEEIKVGDVVLFGTVIEFRKQIKNIDHDTVEEGSSVEEGSYNQISMKIVFLNPTHFDLFEPHDIYETMPNFDENDEFNFLPYLKLKD